MFKKMRTRTMELMMGPKMTSSTTKAYISMIITRSTSMIRQVRIFDMMTSIRDCSSPRSNVIGWTKNLKLATLVKMIRIMIIRAM